MINLTMNARNARLPTVAETRRRRSGPASAARQERILDAAVALASRGGYDAVHIRGVAQRAKVAIGTLYGYYPSKVHLLVAVLEREFGRIDRLIQQPTTTRGGTAPNARVHDLVDRLGRAMMLDPLVTEAMTRAFLFADADAVPAVAKVMLSIDTTFASAISPDDPGQRSVQIARVISDVWLVNLVAWLNRRKTMAEVQEQVHTAIRCLLADVRP